MTPRPDVPRASDVDPRTEVIAAKTEIFRVYNRTWGPTGFNPTDSSARFRPVRNRKREIVPTAYAGLDDETAIAEVLLRGVSALAKGVRRRLYRKQLEDISMATLTCGRDLRLVRMHGSGLTRLHLLRQHVIDCEESDYPYTAEWAQALYGWRKRAHGIIWTSHQNDSEKALVLWEGRVDPGWLEVVGDPVSLDEGPGLDRVRRLCADFGIDLEA